VDPAASPQAEEAEENGIEENEEAIGAARSDGAVAAPGRKKERGKGQGSAKGKRNKNSKKKGRRGRAVRRRATPGARTRD